MKRFLGLMVILVGIGMTGWAQESGHPIIKVDGAPTGACVAGTEALDTTNNISYFCGSTSTWKQNQVVQSVLAYGADPTGVTSSCTAFTNALAAIPSTGGTL